MEDKIVSIDTAKLAKEKGFDNFHSKNLYNECNLVTQSLLQKWLREKHSIHIEIVLEEDPPYNKFYDRIIFIGQWFTTSHDSYSISYEEALENALQNALKLIKK